jgi:hypothetical protein
MKYLILALFVWFLNEAAAQQTIDKLNVKDLKLPSESVSRALFINGSGQVKASSTVSDTELGYLDGLSASITSLLSGKANDADVVKLTGNQTIAGEKTFTSDFGLIRGTTGTARVTISAPASTDPKILSFRTNNVQRWAFRVDGASDNLFVRRYDDSGVFVDAPITVNRANGHIDFSKRYVTTGTSFATIPCPVMTTVQRDAIGSPAEGDCVYNNTTDALNTYTGSAWQAVGSGSSSKPNFIANPSTDQTVSSTAATKVIFNTEEYDSGTIYDPTTNYRFTASETGTYCISVQLYLNGVTANDNLTLEVHKNGTLHSFVVQPMGVTSYSMNYHRQFRLTATDYLEVFVNSQSDTSYQVEGTATGRSWFAGTRCD